MGLKPSEVKSDSLTGGGVGVPYPLGGANLSSRRESRKSVAVQSAPAHGEGHVSLGNPDLFNSVVKTSLQTAAVHH